MAFEVLHGPFVFFGRGPAREGPEIPALAGLRVLFPRIQPVSARLEFGNHGGPPLPALTANSGPGYEAGCSLDQAEFKDFFCSGCSGHPQFAEKAKAYQLLIGITLSRANDSSPRSYHNEPEDRRPHGI